MRTIKRGLLVLLVALYCAWAVVPAYAHALLLRSDPEVNAVLDQAPAQVELYFSEPLEPSLSSIAVLDSNGNVVDLGDTRVDPNDSTRMTVSLHSLLDGVYTVSWKALSAADGHLTTGSFPFAIGRASTAELAAQSSQTSAQLPISALISRWLLLASLALLIGQVSFVTFVWDPALEEAGGRAADLTEPPIWNSLYQIGLTGLLIGLGLGILSEAGQSRGSELAWPWSAEAARLVLETRLGVIWLTRLGLALGSIWLVKSKPASWKTAVAFLAGLSLLLTISLTSHAAVERNSILPVFSDWLHMAGMCVWFGGLAYLLTGLLEIRKEDPKLETRLATACASRFSAMALVSVALVGITGLYAATLRVGPPANLLTTLYGQAMLLKQAFVGMLLVLAAVNLLIISPRLKRARADGALVTRFRKVVATEAALAGLLLLSVSLLTYLPPARIVALSPVQSDSMSVDDLLVRLTIAPAYVGQNTFTVRLTSNGRPVDLVKDVVLRFTPSRGNVAPSEVQLLGTGDGTFSTKGSYLSLPGDWQVQVIVRRVDRFDAFALFNFSINAPGDASGSAALPRLAGGIILADGLLFALVLLAFKGSRLIRWGAGGALALILISAGSFYLVRPGQVVIVQANPIAPNAGSIAAGQTIFEKRCVSCHGETGRGDGPLGKALIPRPADLRLHAVPGVHTDAQLFEWITNGFPGSAMPAFRTILSDTDRWNLVNFIRTLAPQ